MYVFSHFLFLRIYSIFSCLSPLCAKVARAVKAEHIPAPGCECIKAGNPREECGFSVSPSTKKVTM
jgi:hypothetical protein